MSYFIIIRGPLGCGKSTIAERLAKELNAKYIPLDIVLEENGLDKMPPDENIPPENFIKANEIVLPDVKWQLQAGEPVIFDACFYYKEVIEHLEKSLDCPGFVFTLKAPIEVCIERDSKRDKIHGKGAAQAVHNMVSEFDYGHIIDVTKDLDENVNEIISKIKYFYNKK